MEMDITVDEITDFTPVCGGKEACKIINEVLEKNDLQIIRDDVQIEINASRNRAQYLQEEYIQTLIHISELESKMKSLRSYNSVTDLAGFIISKK